MHFISLSSYINGDFSIDTWYLSLHTQRISLQFFIKYSADFIVIFKCITGYFIGVSHDIPSAFHCCFSLHTLHISLRFLITYPAHFMVVFHYIPCAFHCGFSLHTQCISLWFFITYPVHFIVIFHYIPSAFHCGFSLYTQHISLWFFKCSSGYFIAHFIWMPGAFNEYFILSSHIFHCSKNSQELRTKDFWDYKSCSVRFLRWQKFVVHFSDIQLGVSLTM